MLGQESTGTKQGNWAPVFVDCDAACIVGVRAFVGSSRPPPPRNQALVACGLLAAECAICAAWLAAQRAVRQGYCMHAVYSVLVYSTRRCRGRPLAHPEQAALQTRRTAHTLPSPGVYPAHPQHFAVPPSLQCWMNACTCGMMQRRVWRRLHGRVLDFANPSVRSCHG